MTEGRVLHRACQEWITSQNSIDQCCRVCEPKLFYMYGVIAPSKWDLLMENFHMFVNCPLLHNTSWKNYSVYTSYEMASTTTILLTYSPISSAERPGKWACAYLQATDGNWLVTVDIQNTDPSRQWRTEGVGGGVGVFNRPEIPKALQNRAKLNPIVKTV